MERSFVRGHISASAFDDGNQFVIGHWPESPVGPLGDVMWGTPGGDRVLLVPTAEAADFITSIYDFDDVRIDELHVSCDGRTTVVRGHGLAIDLVGGRRRPVPVPRPLAFTRIVEAPIARALMGVQTHGISPRGVTEWYQTNGWRWVTGGSAHLHGRDLGGPRPLTAPLRVGFSEPPRRPSIVGVTVTIDGARIPEAVGGLAVGPLDRQ